MTNTTDVYTFETPSGYIKYNAIGRLLLITSHCEKECSGNASSDLSTLGQFALRHAQDQFSIAMEAKSPSKQELARKAGFRQSPFITTLFERRAVP